MIASGDRLDKEKSRPFSDIVDQVYANPFASAPHEMSANEIKNYIVGKLEDY